ncbi:hypothetical protein HHK36_000430 [Tetracentron sinense]|uniref:PRA1 family protein n=1 Tax=Tetracentron sinense TaxID=13715 RepID=A0A834ZS59_TETSI|nr:hypothetical protein HHK36_000430 [Tetracentron sinense]
MASYGTIQRPSVSSTSASMAGKEEQRCSACKSRREFVLLHYFNIPSSPEAAAVRIIRNLGYLRVYYVLVMWIILFVSLIPRRGVSVIFLIAMTVVTCLYLLLLRAIPNSVILHKIIDHRLVLALLGIVTVVELILTRAVIHLLVSFAIGMPIVLVHAVLSVRDDLYVTEEACAAGELVPLVEKKIGESESPV